MQTKRFSRATILAATDLLKGRLSQAGFDTLVVRVGAEAIVTPDVAPTTPKKAALLARFMMQHGSEVVSTLDGEMTCAEALVREAVRFCRVDSTDADQAAFLRGLELDGYVASFAEEDGRPLLRAALPGDVDLPAADDEVHQLLTQFGFHTPLGHLNQAIEAHARGDWAAANGQARTFLESLFDSIAGRLDPARAGSLTSAENRRALLADVKFFSTERNEWTPDGKNFVNGLFKMLHTDGSHPGLSTAEHSTFRLHLVLITARAFLRRLLTRP